MKNTIESSEKPKFLIKFRGGAEVMTTDVLKTLNKNKMAVVKSVTKCQKKDIMLFR
mgnify:CR=1 FL=1